MTEDALRAAEETFLLNTTEDQAEQNPQEKGLEIVPLLKSKVFEGEKN
ncbi:TPA: hypothetical protein HA338_16830 [Methanosarcina acetivorans]|uniref:Uncharacterized protein n=1 Tax=Methanosarcina acetivorans TaxID=2214 RepID=A0A832SNV5_9EURY|nr:hypothetical protein [Methanosarcina acetivorans]HIH95595.1 hypothetical protein [Methanosarcina acetivorans]